MSTQYYIDEIRRMLHSPISVSMDKGYWFTRLVNSKNPEDIHSLYSDILTEYEFIGDTLL